MYFRPFVKPDVVCIAGQLMTEHCINIRIPNIFVKRSDAIVLASFDQCCRSFWVRSRQRRSMVCGSEPSQKASGTNDEPFD